MADALTKMRAICKTLDDVTESPHFGDIMFKVRKKPFASCGKTEVVVALEPEHVTALVEAEPATYSRYPRAKTNGLVIDTTKVKWGLVEDLVRESYRLVVEKLPKPKRPAATKKKPARPVRARS